MDFPRLVFIVPGDQQRPGGNYGHQLVEDETQFEAAIAEGFHATLPEAIEAHENPEAFQAGLDAIKAVQDAKETAEKERLQALTDAEAKVKADAEALRLEREKFDLQVSEAENKGLFGK